MPVFTIESLDDTRLEPYRNLKVTNLTRWSGLFIAEGVRLTERLLESRFKVASVLVAESHLPRLQGMLKEDVTVYVAPLALLEQVVGFNFHNGMIACGYRQEPIAIEDWFAKEEAPRLIVACPHTADPDNLGTIIRISAAFGADGLLVGSRSCDPFSRRTLRISMGNAFFLPIRETNTFEADLERMQTEYGYESFASVLHPDAGELANSKRSKRMILLLGNESDGLTDEVSRISTHKIIIPMAEQIDSLNVGISSGIMLYHYTQGAGR